MIDFEKNEITLKDKSHTDLEWVVWFLVPQGLCTTLAEALESVKELDMTQHLIRPVAVAIAADGTYEVSLK